ncbi:uncharacterized protein LOC134837715 [Culicoides brevitarsis]|uniref:uncharacterized protein LOC134837715 n=1 Tax=Culicoides brevitarsis TaxID=469753 RepID=UPI00307BE106
MDNKIRIMCFFPLILSVIVTIIYREVNKEPPIDYEEYQKMPPLYLMDDYDACMNGKKGAKYCVVNILIEKDEKSDLWRQIEKFSADYKHHFRHDILKYGFCLDRIRQNLTNFDHTKEHRHSKMNSMVDEIQFRQLGKILKEYSFDVQDEKDLELYVKHKFHTEYALKAHANVSFCISNDTEKQENDSGYFGMNFLVMSLIVIIICVIIIATIFDFCRSQKTLVYPADFCSCISLRTTFTSLFNDPTNSNQLGVFNVIKVVGEMGVIVVHTAYFCFAFPSGIPFSIESQSYELIVPIIRSGVFQLQNLFAVTAFLSFYPSLKKILNGESVTFKDIQRMILKRIFRLWPVIIFVMLVIATFLTRIQDGPIWIDLTSFEMLSCRRNWWTNLLFVNNFVATTTEPCLQHTWHLAAEMQIFVVEMVIILILARFPKKVGTILASVTLLGNFVTAFAFVYSGINGLVLVTVETTRNRNRFDAEFQLGHIPFYTNFPGYCLGLLAAYIHYQIRHKKLDMSSISNTKLRIWAILFFFNLLILLHHSYLVGIVDEPSLIMAIYSTFCKNLGAITTFTLLIFMGNPGISSQNLPQKILGITNVPLIDNLLLKLYEFFNYRLFTVLAKLTLGVFLVHPYVAGWIITDGRHLVMYGNNFDITWIAFSTLIISYFIAAWLFLFVQMPAINLFRLFAFKKSAGKGKKLECTMNNKIRIMCFFPLILSVIVTIIYREINKEPPIDYEEYQKMPPLYLMDDYDDCMNGENGAKYCVVNILIEKDEKSDVWRQIEEFSSDYKHHFRHDILKYGFCLGRIRQNLSNFDVTEANGSSKMNFKIDEIQFRQLGKILKEYSFDVQDEKVLELYVKHKFRTEYALNAHANVSFCISNDAERQETDSGYFGANFLIKSLIVTIIYTIFIATIFDLNRNQNPSDNPTDFCSCISLRTNLTRLFNDPTSSNQFGVFNVIKVVGEAVVVVVHTAYILFVLPSGVPFSFESETYGPFALILRSVTFQLQNFFAISAFLSFYPNLTKILKGEIVTVKDIQWMILKRICRLWPAMIFVMLIIATFLTRIQEGPIWIDFLSCEMLSCRRNWWTNLLFVNNFVSTTTEPCLLQTWHLAAEMQLLVVEILVILILTRFPKKVGTIIASVTLLGIFFTTTAFYKSGINGLVLGTVEDARTRYKFDAEFQLGHIPFYTNLPGFCLGLLAAYVYHQIKHRKLNLNSISKTKLRIWYVLFFFNALILLYHSYYIGIVDEPSLIMAFCSTFCKNLGAFVTFTLLILVESPGISTNKLMMSTGISLFDTFLLKLYKFCNHRLFKVLVKLNLGVFLVHPYVTGRIITDGRHLVMYGNAFDIAWIGFSTLIVSYFIAAWLFLFIEMPAINLFRFFSYKKPAGKGKKLEWSP